MEMHNCVSYEDVLQRTYLVHNKRQLLQPDMWLGTLAELELALL